MSIQVVPQMLKHHYNGVLTELIYLRQKAGTSRIYTEEDLSKEIQEATSLAMTDVTHVMGAFVSELRKVLVRGNRVRIAGLGTFYITLRSKGVETEEDCTVRQIQGVNVRFLPNRGLKLVNNALAPTRSDNNVSFAIVGKPEETADGDSAGGSGGGVIDPDA